MNVDEKLSFLKELIHCKYDMAFREYDEKGLLLSAEPASKLADELLEKSGCLKYAVENAEDTPLFLSSGLGLLWGAVGIGEKESRRVHIIGPVLNTVVSSSTIDETLYGIYPNLKKKQDFHEYFLSLPIIPMQMFQHYILMLGLALTGRKMHVSEIVYQTAKQSAQKNDQSLQKRNRHFTYMAEQELLYNVREGNMNFTKALEKSSSLSTGVQIKSENPIGQAQISVIVFTSLCAREAIKGGLSPDIAHSVGDAYIQNMVEAKTISELSLLSNAMYIDFIRRVKGAKTDAKYSPVVRDCCDYIQTHIGESINAGALAEQFGYTPYYLSRKFKSETGTSITRYIDSVRIEKAKMLLISTRDSITDIASSLCYCSASYFGESFRRTVGVLPGEFRKNPEKYNVNAASTH